MPASSPLRVKICGLSTPATLDAAIEAGADLVGFVFFPASPRHLTLATARDLARRARGHAEIAALTVDADDDTFAAIVEAVEPDWLQLHGKEQPDRVRAVAARHGRSVMKALGISAPADLDAAAPYATAADLLLFDAKPPRGAALPGGNGVAFDWTILQRYTGSAMLSGGLTPDNVATAIAASGATAVDVSSGVESAPGIKDAAKIRAFIAAARSGGLA